MNGPSSLLDACLACPGFPAVLPAQVTAEESKPDSLRATYECGQGHAWTCWWDRQAAGWPVEGIAA